MHAHTLPLIPAVRRSDITPAGDDGILVVWDRAMTESCDIKDQINIIIDGAAPIHPETVVFTPDHKTMGLIMAAPFTPNQTVTWAYDDTGACDLTEAAAPNTEAENQTYAVINHLTCDNKHLTADNTICKADSVLVTADNQEI